jgi:hypothetical protein
MKKRVVLVLAVLLRFALPEVTRAQGFPTAMQKIYMDQSHCLTSADMRSEKDTLWGNPHGTTASTVTLKVVSCEQSSTQAVSPFRFLPRSLAEQMKGEHGN